MIEKCNAAVQAVATKGNNGAGTNDDKEAASTYEACRKAQNGQSAAMEGSPWLVSEEQVSDGDPHSVDDGDKLAALESLVGHRLLRAHDGKQGFRPNT